MNAPVYMCERPKRERPTGRLTSKIVTKPKFFKEAATAVLGSLVLVLTVAPVASVDAQGSKRATTGPGQVVNPPSIPGARSGSPFEPLGVRLGGFLLNPHLDFEYVNDDNVFARGDRVESDSITVLRPGFNMRSIWSNHSLKLFGDYEAGRYSDFDSEDYDDWILGAEGRIDVDRLRNVTLGINVGGEKEDRALPDDERGSNPTEKDFTRLHASWYQALNRVYYRLGGDIEDLDFADIETPTSNINNDDRDRSETSIFGEVGYEFTPGYSAFVRLETEDIDYDLEVDDNGDDRDSSGETIKAGVGFDITDVIEGNVFAGYRDREFDDPTLTDISGGLVGASVKWHATGLTTIDVTADRIIEETTVEGASGYYRTSLGVDAEHELYRNFILSAGIGFYDDDYEGLDRKDDGFNWNLGGTYLSNRWLRVRLEFAHEDRDTSAENAVNADYDRDIFRLYIRGVR